MLNTKRLSRQRGVTMVETALVLSVAAVLAALAVPSHTAWQGHSRIRATAEAIQSGLNLARLEAITRNASSALRFSPTRAGAWAAPRRRRSARGISTAASARRPAAGFCCA